MKTRIDHLVVGALNLQQGVSYVKEVLGVIMPYGGMHVQMGTHNHLMQLGKDVFLEVISINPDIDPPKAPRWYGLDDPFIKRQIEKQPVFLTWVVNTKNINKFIQKASVSFGTPELISRGELRWHFGVPDDGRLIAGGMLPYVIEWQTDHHPASNMADEGCRLKSIEIHHPLPFWIKSVLESIDASALVKVHALPKNEVPHLIANIDTSSGERKLHSNDSLFNNSLKVAGLWPTP
jgi:hypothetical protein